MRNKEPERKLLSKLRANGDQLVIGYSCPNSQQRTNVDAQLTGQGSKTPRVYVVSDQKLLEGILAASVRLLAE